MSIYQVINIKVPAFLLAIYFLLPVYAIGETSNLNFVSAKQLDETAHDIWLLSTITGSESRTKAIIKNLITEEVDSYGENSNIEIIKDRDVRLVKVFPCLVVIETGMKYEKITCEGSRLNSSHFRAEKLWQYSVDKPGRQFVNNRYNNTFDDQIIAACSKYDVDPHLVKAIIKAESNFDPRAVSPKQAQGLMQLIPSTAKSYGVTNTFDPVSNINGGVKVLRDLLDHFKDTTLAVAAYNAGKNAVIRHNNSIPPYPETRVYVKRVMGYYKDLRGKDINRSAK